MSAARPLHTADSSMLERGAREAGVALETLYSQLRRVGCAVPESAAGQLIRPLLCLAGARGLGLPESGALWSAAAALQLAHEASLLHDDVIDHADIRRGKPTMVADRGVAAALVEGDHLLTTSYRLAATSSPGFVVAFAHAVERTVAGEKLQGRSTGMVLDERSYRRIVGWKSGELLGCALAAASLVAGDSRATRLYALGRAIGTLYQMLDDLLDYCPSAETGKAPLADYRQRRWTWPLLELQVSGRSLFEAADTIAVMRAFTAPDTDKRTALRRCLDRFDREADVVRAGIAIQLPHDAIATELVASWVERAHEAVARMEREHDPARVRVQSVLRQRTPPRQDLVGFFRQNSHSFSFAARLFPAPIRHAITGVYGFCRVTDDIADGALGEPGITSAERLLLLDEWERLAHAAWHGRTTDIALLDDVMSTAAAAGVPFDIVSELVEGMRMDLCGTRYATLTDLRVYSHRVAGVVGQWITRLCGVHDDAVLDSAAALGHAMQLTNILRDVGDDLRAGRIYLPTETLAGFGLSEAQLRGFGRGEPVTAAYRRMIEHLMERADEDYARALMAATALPPFFRRPVVVAAHVYRGIHDSIRRNGFDNFRQRAQTGRIDKLRLAVVALSGGAIRHAPRVTPFDGTSSTALAVAAPARRGRTARSALRILAAIVASGLVAGSAPAMARQVGTPAEHEARLGLAIEAAPHDTKLRLDLVRALFFTAVDDASSIARGQQEIALLRSAAPDFAERHAPLLLAYEGAFIALTAKHGVWPVARLRAVRRGLGQLDDAVALAPHDIEVRYLRLVNAFYLPSLFGRGAMVREDLHVTAALLADDHARGNTERLPTELARVILQFVIDHGELSSELVDELCSALAAISSDDGARR